MQAQENLKKNSVPEKFGTFKGVFTPSILTILGVIMYLRFGWVVGEAGLLGTIAVVLLAHAVSITTGLSICAVATNRTVKTGGDYYMISRSLGLPIGGALGIALFFALGFSMSLYVLGFAESFLNALHMDATPFNLRLVGTVSCVLLTMLTFFSTSLALRIQYLVLAAIALSMVSLFMGDSPTPPAGPMMWFGKDAAAFETVFAVFFPAVTGFTAGVAMSGDLKDPRKGIPIGTIASILVGLLVYLSIPVFLAYKVDPELLRTDNMVWMRVARFPILVTAGVFAATLSSALGSVLGAPRYLQALAYDGIVPKFLGKGHGPTNEPRIGTIITFMVAQAGVLIGELDLIARIVTMFFLTSYGFLCLASGIQTWSGVSSFRPDFRTPALISFAGAALCFGLMFKLDTMAMAASMTVMFLIFLAIKRKETGDGKDTWGGFWAAVVQKGILRLYRRPLDGQNFRPNALVFGGDPLEREHLIQLSKWLFDHRGLATYVSVIEGSLQRNHSQAEKLEKNLQKAVGKIYPEMLTRVVVNDTLFSGILYLTQAYGLPGMIPNTIVMGAGRESENPAAFTNLVRDLLVLDFNLALVSYDVRKAYGNRQSIDIWWGGMERNGPLMLLVAYLLKTSDEWSKATVRVNVIVNEVELEQRRTRLDHVLQKSRVNAQSNMVIRDPAKTAIQIIAETSKDTDLTIIGLAPPKDTESTEFVDRVKTFVTDLGTTIILRASTRFDGEEVLYDD